MPWTAMLQTAVVVLLVAAMTLCVRSIRIKHLAPGTRRQALIGALTILIIYAVCPIAILGDGEVDRLDAGRTGRSDRCLCDGVAGSHAKVVVRNGDRCASRRVRRRAGAGVQGLRRCRLPRRACRCWRGGGDQRPVRGRCDAVANGNSVTP